MFENDYLLEHLGLQESILQEGRSSFLVYQAMFMGVVAVFVAVLFQLSAFEGFPSGPKNLALLAAQLVMFVLASVGIVSGKSNHHFSETRVAKRSKIVTMLQQLLARSEEKQLQSDLDKLGLKEDHVKFSVMRLIKIAERHNDLQIFIKTKLASEPNRILFAGLSEKQLCYCGWIATGSPVFARAELHDLLSQYSIVGNFTQENKNYTHERTTHFSGLLTLWRILIALAIIGGAYVAFGVVRQFGLDGCVFPSVNCVQP